MTDPLVPFTSHLSEAERQCAADGTLHDDERAAVARHLAECAECAADVARLRAFIARVHDRSAPAGNPRDLWPAIRARIEQGKVIALEAPEARTASTQRRPRAKGWWWLAGGAAAAAVLIALALEGPPRRSAVPPVNMAQSRERTITQVADSSRVYEEQISPLLEELELRRSMLPPAAAASIDHDLRLIDGAIAELEEALKQDPNNTALRQLLAASYRQKRDLLRRVDNAS